MLAEVRRTLRVAGVLIEQDRRDGQRQWTTRVLHVALESHRSATLAGDCRDQQTG
jgi:hypothetical protein